MQKQWQFIDSVGDVVNSAMSSLLGQQHKAPISLTLGKEASLHKAILRIHPYLQISQS